jgi:resorcinol 4-hydroxylase (NADPH)
MHVVGGRGADVDDLDGRYTPWFDELGADAVVVRPDFYVCASLPTVRDLAAALDQLDDLVPATALVPA